MVNTFPFVSKYIFPLACFSVGWYGGRVALSKDYIPESILDPLLLSEIRLVAKLQSCFPEKLVSRYGVDPKVLDAQLQQLLEKRSKDVGDDSGKRHRISFADVLKECNEAEQTCFLEDHFLETIPFFYISDIVYSWVQLHHNFYLPEQLQKHETKHSDQNSFDPCHALSTSYSANNGCALTDQDNCYLQRMRSTTSIQEKQFQSKVLCSGLWDKLKDKVIPFDVSVCALAILASSSRKNRELLAGIVRPEEIVKEYNDYMGSHTSTSKPNSHLEKSEYVPAEEVRCATRSLLYALDEGKRTFSHSLVSKMKRIVLSPFFAPQASFSSLQELLNELN